MLKLVNDVERKKANIRGVFREWNATIEAGQFNGMILMDIKKSQVELKHRNDAAEDLFSISDNESITSFMIEADRWVRKHDNIRQWKKIRPMVDHFMRVWGKTLEAKLTSIDKYENIYRTTQVIVQAIFEDDFV